MATLDIIYLSITGVSMLFSAYLYFRNPQVELEKKQAVDDEKVISKAEVLAQQFMDEKEVNQRRFIEMGKRLDDSFALAQNHTHSISVQVETLTTIVNANNVDLRVAIGKLEALLQERK